MRLSVIASLMTLACGLRCAALNGWNGWDSDQFADSQEQQQQQSADGDGEEKKEESTGDSSLQLGTDWVRLAKQKLLSLRRGFFCNMHKSKWKVVHAKEVQICEYVISRAEGQGAGKEWLSNLDNVQLPPREATPARATRKKVKSGAAKPVKGTRLSSAPLITADKEDLLLRSRFTFKRQWLTRSCHPPLAYVPQVGDDVVYIPQGHEASLVRYPWDTLKPWQQWPEIWAAVQARVVGIQYSFPPKEALQSRSSSNKGKTASIECILKLQLVKVSTHILDWIRGAVDSTYDELWTVPRQVRKGRQDSASEFTITLRPNTEHGDYIVLKSR